MATPAVNKNLRASHFIGTPWQHAPHTHRAFRSLPAGSLRGLTASWQIKCMPLCFKPRLDTQSRIMQTDTNAFLSVMATLVFVTTAFA